MVYTVSQITQMVRAAIARGPSPQRLIDVFDPDVVTIDHLIRMHMEPAARYVYSRAPMHLLAEAARDLSAEGVYWHEASDGLCSGHLLLPPDFLRLVVFEMSDWRRPVFEAFDADSPYFDIAASDYAGVRGSPRRPVCTVAFASEGRRLGFYSCGSTDAEIVQAEYLPVPSVDRDGGLDIAPRCLPLLVNVIAAATLTSMGQFEMARHFQNMIDI